MFARDSEAAGYRLKSPISGRRCSTVEAMQPSSSRAGMTTESSVSGRALLVSEGVGILNKKGGDLFDRRLFVEGLSTQRILPP